MTTFDNAHRQRRLAARHHLAVSTQRVDTVADDLVGIHSSDPATVFLACQARVQGFEPQMLQEALYERRDLLRILAMRRTMFVAPVELANIMDAACSQALAPGQHKRLLKLIQAQAQALGADDPEGWLADVEAQTLKALADMGPSTAAELTERVPNLGLKLTAGHGKWTAQVGLSTRVLFLLAVKGHIVRGRPKGTWRSSLYHWAAISDWIPNRWAPPEPASARAQLLRRWLRTYGPATMTDVRWWSGWGVRVAKAALKDIQAVQVALEDQQVGYVLPGDETPDANDPAPWTALLPGLDPTIMGWKERGWFLGPHQDALFDRNGNVGPTVWADGRIVGGWASTPKGVRFKLLEPVSNAQRLKIEAQAAALEGWLGEHVVTPRFRTPLEKTLSREAGGK